MNQQNELHLSPKVMADFFRHKNQHDAFIQFAQFFVDSLYMLAVISYEKYMDFWH